MRSRKSRLALSKPLSALALVPLLLCSGCDYHWTGLFTRDTVVELSPPGIRFGKIVDGEFVPAPFHTVYPISSQEELDIIIANGAGLIGEAFTSTDSENPDSFSATFFTVDLQGTPISPGVFASDIFVRVSSVWS